MTVASSEDDSFKPYWYIIIEAIYILIYLAISITIHQLGVLKNDEDAVTIHHRIHKEIIAQQELYFMNQMKENFLKTSQL